MIYQLTKTSVGLSGQVKWNLILNGNKVQDFQLTPIHESVNFNYTRRDDVFNYTHIQNLNRLYNKIPSDFFQSVVSPTLNTGYPVRNSGARLDTHENSYEMGMKRILCKRYGKQFAFFCPVWCDDKEQIKNIVFKLVIKNKQGVVLSTRELDHSLIKDYISQFVDEINLNSDLVCLDFNKYQSWIKGVNVQDGRVQIKNTLGIIDNIKSSERTILETDSAILNQFSNNKMICGQLFNFNFIFDINDIILPQLMKEFLGEVVNVYIDIYYKDSKIPLKDIYSNYEFIPKYDIYEERYTKKNCLDYLKDYTNIDSITKNKLVQSTFHWSLVENPSYMLNFYDGCCPSYRKSDSRGLNFDGVDFSSNVWDPKKNQLGWCHPLSIKGSPMEFDISTKMGNIFNNISDNHWYHIYKLDNEEVFWINNILYRNSIQWSGEYNRQGTPILNTDVNGKVKSIKPSLYKDMYFNVTFVPSNICGSIIELDDALDREGFKNTEWGAERLFFKCSLEQSLGDRDTNKVIYVLLGKSDKDLTYYNMISFLVFLKEDSYLNEDPNTLSRLFIRNLIVKYPINESGVNHQETPTKCGSLNELTSQVLLKDPETGLYKWTKDVYYSDIPESSIYPSTQVTPVMVDKTKTYRLALWNRVSDNAKLLYNLRSLIRTLAETLNHIIEPNIIVFEKSIESRPVQKPHVLGKYHSDVLSETVYYNSDKFSYVFRYDGKLMPYFIDVDNKKELIYNNTYIAKQYNQQINVLECSDSDMILFNDYASTKFSPLYPSLDYFSLRRKRCIYDRYHRGTRRYLGEKSWYKSNSLYVLPHYIQITYRGKSLNEKTIKSLFKAEINKIMQYNIYKNPTKIKKNNIFEHFIYPLYEYSYQFEYENTTNIDQYIYTIKYTLK